MSEEGEVSNLPVMTPSQKFKVVDYTTCKHEYAEYGAFFMEWPLFTFGDSFGNLFVYNAYKNYMIQRIPLDPEGKKTDLRICKIFIASDYNMYVMTYSEGYFHLYAINLRTYANMGLVEEFENAIMERIKAGGNKTETLSRLIKVSEPILEYA
jgi:hypothetical protein